MKQRKNKFTSDFGPAARNIDEGYEPTELKNPVPWPFIAIAMALAIAGAVTLYFDAQATDGGEDAQLARTAIDEGTASADATAAEKRAAEGDHSASQGAALFGTYCATCHQTNGSGVRGAIPPLDESRYVVADAQVSAAILLRGIAGPIEVKGDIYNGRMPTFHAALEDEQIALILTYIRSAWSNNASEVAAEQVAAVRQTLGSELAYPWKGGFELQSAFGIEYMPATGSQAKVGTTPPTQDEEGQEDAQ
ncbi:MAG: c-type cytochrome [Marinobacter sp.]